MGSNWTLKEAETEFVTLAQAARDGQPQRVIMDNDATVVVVSASQYDLMAKRPKTFVEHILDFPKLPEGMDDIFDDRDEYQADYRDVEFD